MRLLTVAVLSAFIGASAAHAKQFEPPPYVILLKIPREKSVVSRDRDEALAICNALAENVGEAPEEAWFLCMRNHLEPKGYLVLDPEQFRPVVDTLIT